MMKGETCVGGNTLLCHARRIVSDAVWGGAYPQYDNRTVLEAVLWIARTGSPGRDLPAEFGRWDTIYQRCHRRCQDGVFSGGRFEGLTADLELDWDTVMVAGTFVKVHQHSAGARECPRTAFTASPARRCTR